MAVFASVLARERLGAFGWLDCSAQSAALDPVTRDALGESLPTGLSSPIGQEELIPPRDGEHLLRQWLIDDAVSTEVVTRVGAYLRLPSLLQRLVSRVAAADGRAVVLLWNVDALPRSALELALGSADVHEILRGEGVSLIAAFRGEPSGPLRAPFDRVYRIESTPGESWQAARVTQEQGEPGDGFSAGTVLGRRLAVDGSIEPPSDLNGPIPGHRLR